MALAKRYLWRHDVAVSTTENLIQQSLNSGSAQVQILPVPCGTFAMAQTSDSCLGLRLIAFR